MTQFIPYVPKASANPTYAVQLSYATVPAILELLEMTIGRGRMPWVRTEIHLDGLELRSINIIFSDYFEFGENRSSEHVLTPGDWLVASPIEDTPDSDYLINVLCGTDFHNAYQEAR